MTNSAQFSNFDADPGSTERDLSATGNVQDPSKYKAGGTTVNPDGATAFGNATDNTITETAPDSKPPAVQVTQDIPAPKTDEGGGGGGVQLPPPATRQFQQLTVDLPPVALSNSALLNAPQLAAEPRAD